MLAHVSIVKRANIPPKNKLPLVENIFQAMTATVAAAKLAHEFASALTTIERFLAIFPEPSPRAADACGAVRRVGERPAFHRSLGRDRASGGPGRSAAPNGSLRMPSCSWIRLPERRCQPRQRDRLSGLSSRVGLPGRTPGRRRVRLRHSLRGGRRRFDLWRPLGPLRAKVSPEGSQEGRQVRDVLAALLAERGFLRKSRCASGGTSPKIALAARPMT